MTQSLILIGLFMAALVCMPWAVDRLKKRYGLAQTGPAGASRLVNALAVGPHQKVVTVEVGPSDARVWLVLGVTQQSIQCLHRMPVAQSSNTISTSDFSDTAHLSPHEP